MNKTYPGNVIGLFLAVWILSFAGCAHEDQRRALLNESSDVLGIDIFEGEIRREFEPIWLNIHEVLKSQGNITYHSEGLGRMEADIGQYHVTVRLRMIEIRFGLVRIQVLHQETSKPDLLLAENLFKQIASKLK